MKVLRNQGLLQTYSDLWYKSEKNSGDKLKKNSGVQELKRFEADLNFSRPSFSEIKVQIKWLNMMSNDGLIIENMDLSHIYLAVLI